MDRYETPVTYRPTRAPISEDTEIGPQATGERSRASKWDRNIRPYDRPGVGRKVVAYPTQEVKRLLQL